MTLFLAGLTGAVQLQRWAQNLTSTRLKWRVKRAGSKGRARFATPNSWEYEEGSFIKYFKINILFDINISTNYL